MPRLDWQMWFAALESRCRGGWFFHFLDSLLKSSSPVLSLLADNPFSGERPEAIRVRRVRGRFTTAEIRAEEGTIWTYEARSDYCPEVTREAMRVE